MMQRLRAIPNSVRTARGDASRDQSISAIDANWDSPDL
jgi:hypothetical protein